MKYLYLCVRQREGFFFLKKSILLISFRFDSNTSNKCVKCLVLQLLLIYFKYLGLNIFKNIAKYAEIKMSKHLKILIWMLIDRLKFH